MDIEQRAASLHQHDCAITVWVGDSIIGTARVAARQGLAAAADEAGRAAAVAAYD